jgi:hypothetical protein
MSENAFMTPEEVAEFTGIKTGKRINGKTVHREELQAEWLRTQGIPFHVNARGVPKILWSAIAGTGAAAPQSQQLAWQPKALKAA